MAIYLLGFQQDHANVRNRGDGEAKVAGQFMLIRRSAYQQVGGHAAVGAAICEDLELARLMNRFGFSIALMDGSRLLSTRMYTGWATLWPGFAKNVLEMFGGVGSTLTTAAFSVVLSWSLVILPAIDCFSAGGGPLEGSIAFGLAIAAAAAAVGFHVAGAAHFRVPAMVRPPVPCRVHIGRGHRLGRPSPATHRPRALEGPRLSMTEPREPQSENGASEAVDVVAVLLIAFVVIVFFYFIHLVLLPFVFSAVTAFVLTPFVDWLAKTIRAPRLAAR